MNESLLTDLTFLSMKHAFETDIEQMREILHGNHKYSRK